MHPINVQSYVLGLLAVQVLVGCTAAGDEQAADKCQVAQIAIGTFFDGSDKSGIVFSDSFPSSSADLNQIGLDKLGGQGWLLFHPKAPLKDRFEEYPITAEDKGLFSKIKKEGLGSAISSCPETKTYLRQKGASFGNEISSDIGQHDVHDLYPNSSAYVSLPVISDDGQTALIVVSSSSGPLAGGGSLIKFRKVKGVWQKAGAINLWIA